MKNNHLNTLAILLSVAVFVCAFGGCKKEGEDNSNASVTTAKTTISSKTTTQTASRTTATNISSNTPAATENIISTNTIEETPSAPEENMLNENELENPIGAGIEIKIDEKLGEKSIDLGGRTVTLSTWNPTDVYEDKPGSSAYNIVLARRIKAAEEKYNFKLEYKVHPGAPSSTQYYIDIVNEAMAGIMHADIITTSSLAAFPNQVRNNIIIPLDDYIDYEAPIMKVNTFLWYGSLYNGKHYGAASGSFSAYPRIMYNYDILNREGQPDIIDLVENNQWTWETFLEIMKGCTKDVDGDGIIDQWGISAAGPFYLALNLLYSNGITGVDIINGVPTVDLYKPEAIRALQFASDLKFVHKVYDNTSTKNIYMAGKAAIYIDSYYHNTSFLTGGINSKLVALPMGPDVNSYQNVGNSIFQGISSLSERAEDIAKVWAETRITWTEEGEYLPEIKEIQLRDYPYDWEWSISNVNRLYTTEREYNAAMALAKSIFKVDFAAGYTGLTTKMSTEIIGPIFAGTTNVTQAINSKLSVLQDLIDNY